MNSNSCRRSRFWPLAGVAVALSCIAFGALLVPEAAEHEEGEVSFGEAVGTPPKAGAKAPKPGPAGQPATTTGKRAPPAAKAGGAKKANKGDRGSAAARTVPAAKTKDKGPSKALKK